MLLEIEDLHTSFDSPAGPVPVVKGVSLRVARGETVALVGESGCGKSVTALSVLGLLPPGGRITAGSIRLEGRELTKLPAGELRRLRGNRVAVVFQEPMTSLNPLLTIGTQIEEPLRLHRGLATSAARAEAVRLLGQVRIGEPARSAKAYPHQLSGGMRQRVMIAMALACAPDVLIADEPTTALDVTVQAQILALLREVQAQHRLGLLFITHDLAVVSELAARVHVMYAGRIVEHGPTAQVLGAPAHPYTQGLLRSTLRLEQSAARGALPVIPGEVPSAEEHGAGCAFAPRCTRIRGDERCTREAPELRPAASGTECACWRS